MYKNSAVSLIPRSQTQLCQWHRKDKKKISVIFHSFFPIQYRENFMKYSPLCFSWFKLIWTQDTWATKIVCRWWRFWIYSQRFLMLNKCTDYILYAESKIFNTNISAKPKPWSNILTHDNQTPRFVSLSKKLER